jgi:hypothetical protein
MVGSAGYGWWDDDESFKDTATLPGLKDIQFVFDVFQDFEGTFKFQNRFASNGAPCSKVRSVNQLGLMLSSFPP